MKFAFKVSHFLVGLCHSARMTSAPLTDVTSSFRKQVICAPFNQHVPSPWCRAQFSSHIPFHRKLKQLFFFTWRGQFLVQLQFLAPVESFFKHPGGINFFYFCSFPCCAVCRQLFWKRKHSTIVEGQRLETSASWNLHTPHHNPPNTITTPHGDRHKETKREEEDKENGRVKRGEKILSVCARFLSLLTVSISIHFRFQCPLAG